MKQLLIFIVAVHLIGHLHGQKPLVSIDTTSQWNMSQYVFALENDTIIQDKNFKKLIEYKDFEKSKILKTYFLREDTTGKVFLSDTKEEIVIFDFSLTTGDSLILDFLGDNSSYKKLFIKVDSIGEIILSNNEEYQAQFVSICNYYKDKLNCDFTYSDVWVKGIGSLGWGIVYPPLFIIGGSIPFQLCYLANNEVVYQSPDCSDCFTFVSAELNEVSPQLIKLYPNKNGLLKLQPINGNKGEFSLYLLDGKQIIKQRVNETLTQFYVPKEGVLLYRFVTEKGEIQTGKVIIN